MPRSIDSYIPPEIQKNPSEYQGQLICTVEDTGRSDVHFYDAENNRITECTKLTQILTGQNGDIVKRKKRTADEKKELIEKEIEKSFIPKDKKYIEEIVEILQTGKLRLHLLLNSQGRPKYEYDFLIAIMQHIKRHEGLTEAYAKNIVQGFPALAFIQADTRYALKKSLLKWFPEWYTGSVYAADYIVYDKASKELAEREKEKNRQTALTRSLLQKTAADDKAKEISEILYRSKGSQKHPPEFVLTGAELFDLGIVHHLFTDEAALKERFAQTLLI